MLQILSNLLLKFHNSFRKTKYPTQCCRNGISDATILIKLHPFIFDGIFGAHIMVCRIHGVFLCPLLAKRIGLRPEPVDPHLEVH